MKFHKDEIPVELRVQGIKNLLRPGWVGGAKIVLTTYETLRDQGVLSHAKNGQLWFAMKLKNKESSSINYSCGECYSGAV